MTSTTWASSVGKSVHHGHGLTLVGKRVFDKLAAKIGTVLVIVAQPASIGALPLAVAPGRLQGSYLPGRGQVRREGRRGYHGRSPHHAHTLRLLELTMLVGFDQDLAAEVTCTSNRIRGLLTQFSPSLERVLGPRLDQQAVTWLKAPRMAQCLIDKIFDALDEQTVLVTGTGTLDVVVTSLARSLPFTNRDELWKHGSGSCWRLTFLPWS